MNILENHRKHLANLLLAIQRCIYFLEESDKQITWELSADYLEENQKNVKLFESLASINERFSKLQDILGSAMQHSLLIINEKTETFLAVLVFFEKLKVINSPEEWINCRLARNMAAHEYEVDYQLISEHFNTLHQLKTMLYSTSGNFNQFCYQHAKVSNPSSPFLIDVNEIIIKYSKNI